MDSNAILTSAASNYYDDEASPNLFIVWHQHDLTTLMPSEGQPDLADLEWIVLIA